MKTKAALYALILLFLALALSSCAGSKKTRCSCPNFRGSRAIYGKADDFKFQNPNYKKWTCGGGRISHVASQDTTYLWR